MPEMGDRRGATRGCTRHVPALPVAGRHTGRPLRKGFPQENLQYLWLEFGTFGSNAAFEITRDLVVQKL